jgi:hypothetical protein
MIEGEFSLICLSIMVLYQSIAINHPPVKVANKNEVVGCKFSFSIIVAVEKMPDILKARPLKLALAVEFIILKLSLVLFLRPPLQIHSFSIPQSLSCHPLILSPISIHNPHQPMSLPLPKLPYHHQLIKFIS